MSDQASQSIERFSVTEKSEYDDAINTVLNTDDAVKAKSAFTASTAREILDNKTGRIVGSVEWVQKSGDNRAPNFNLDESFNAVLEGRPEPELNIAPPQPAQDDLFGKVESSKDQMDHEEVVQLDFEPEEVNSSEMSQANQTIADIEKITKSDFENEHEISSQKPSLDNHLTSNVETGPLLYEPLENRVSTNEIGSKLDAESGRWQVISSDTESRLSSILFTTDDQNEAMDAFKGYEPDLDCELHIYDATNGQRLISRHEAEIGSAEQSTNVEKNNDNVESIEKHIDKAFSSLGENQMDDAVELSPDSAPETDAPNDKIENHGDNEWKSLKTNQKREAVNEPENDDLEDDQIFGQGSSYSSGYRGAPSGGTYQTSILGAIGSSLASSVRNIVGRDRNSPEPSIAENVGENIDVSKQSFEAQFNSADADQWKVKQLDREMSIVNSDIQYSIDAINRLANSEYSKLAREIESSENPSDDQMKKLSTLKESTSVSEAKSDIESHINNVETRVARILKDESLPKEAKKEVEATVKNRSKEVDKSMDGLPNDDFKKDLLSKIKKLIDLIVDRLSPKTSSDPSPSSI